MAARGWRRAASLPVVKARPRIALWLVAGAAAAAVAAGALAAAGGGGGTRFDVGRAYALVRLQLSYGPRPAGSAAERLVAQVLRRMLPGGRFEPVPGGLRNIVGELPGRAPAIVVSAHYDTTPVPGYLGANNSATGVGAVIELARDLGRDQRRAGLAAVRFVLFDGEEAPAGFTDFLSQGLRGSRASAAAHAGQTREAIVLDFIALHGERLARDAGSDPALWERLRAAAQGGGAGALFPAATQNQVLDDHTPFVAAGVPAIDLIDFDYPCWQRVCDDLSQVSRASLARVGASVLALVRGERRR